MLSTFCSFSSSFYTSSGISSWFLGAAAALFGSSENRRFFKFARVPTSRPAATRDKVKIFHQSRVPETFSGRSLGRSLPPASQHTRKRGGTDSSSSCPVWSGGHNHETRTRTRTLTRTRSLFRWNSQDHTAGHLFRGHFFFSSTQHRTFSRHTSKISTYRTAQPASREAKIPPFLRHSLTMVAFSFARQSCCLLGAVCCCCFFFFFFSFHHTAAPPHIILQNFQRWRTTIAQDGGNFVFRCVFNKGDE